MSNKAKSAHSSPDATVVSTSSSSSNKEEWYDNGSPELDDAIEAVAQYLCVAGSSMEEFAVAWKIGGNGGDDESSNDEHNGIHINNDAPTDNVPTTIITTRQPRRSRFGLAKLFGKRR